MNEKTNQWRILNHLKNGKPITSMEAFQNYGVTRLSAIIYNLRNKGFDVQSERIKGKNRYGEPVSFSSYFLPQKKTKSKKK